jgi:hypothetical protein
MGLYSERRREKQLREAEARGESVWTNKFSQRVRIKVRHALAGAIALVPEPMLGQRPGDIIHYGIWNALRDANWCHDSDGAWPF